MTRRDPPLATLRRGIAKAVGAVVLAGLAMPAAHATICKYIDAEGTIHYTNVSPDRGWRKLSCEIADDTPARRATGGGGTRSSATPANFPRVEAATQRSRDDMRRKVLDDELASEEKLLGEARAAYGNGAPAPLADEKNDAEKYRQRIARLRQTVQVHERNVEALRKEIAAIR
ncbi:MAG TPA: DUF4124 domain-containing protein [Casimicrobiaceae bacterium]